jgi:hypothetical protein
VNGLVHVYHDSRQVNGLVQVYRDSRQPLIAGHHSKARSPSQLSSHHSQQRFPDIGTKEAGREVALAPCASTCWLPSTRPRPGQSCSLQLQSSSPPRSEPRQGSECSQPAQSPDLFIIFTLTCCVRATSRSTGQAGLSDLPLYLHNVVYAI